MKISLRLSDGVFVSSLSASPDGGQLQKSVERTVLLHKNPRNEIACEREPRRQRAGTREACDGVGREKLELSDRCHTGAGQVSCGSVAMVEQN